MKWLTLTNIVLSIYFALAKDESNNVCRTFPDYYHNFKKNPNCSYNPDIDLSAIEIISRYGYTVMNYTVTTEDGYILSVFRIPYGNLSLNHKPGPPVFLQHGLGTSCMVFIDRGYKSLAFVLANSGYDVWIGNFRGTRYSNTNLYFSNKQRKYWNYTVNELGIYDIPAQLDIVVKETKRKVIYIGYSMGTTSYYIYSSKFPAAAQQKIKLAVSMAPITYLNHITTPAKVLIPFWPIVEAFLEIISDCSILGRTPTNLALKNAVCLPYPFQMKFCDFIYGLLFGFDPAQEDPETLPITISQNLDAVAIKVLGQYIQIIRSKRFQEYDYGIRNKQIYGTFKPPEYNLSECKIPNLLIRAPNDPLATKKNTELLYDALPDEAKPFGIHVVNYTKFTHTDFDSAKDVVTLVYDHIVTFLNTNAPKYH